MAVRNVWVRTADAKQALRDEIWDKVSDTTHHNTLVSLDEQQALPAFIQDAANALRAEKGPGATVTVDEIVDKATARAMSAWEEFNPPGLGKDSDYLSRAEIKQIASRDPELGELTKQAYNHISLRAAQGRFYGYELEGATKRRLEKYGFLRIRDVAARMHDPDNRARMPEKLLESYDFYFKNVEEADWGNVYHDSQYVVHKNEIEDVHILYVTTDGDDGYVEAFSKAGEPLASGRLQADGDGGYDVVSWDDSFGEIRGDFD